MQSQISLLEYIVKTYGYWALLVGTFLEGETILMLGGITAHLGYLKLPIVMIVAFIGSFSGDQFYFFLGRKKGKELLSRNPKWERRADRAHRLLEKYHDLIMLGFRFVYGTRIMIPIVLGMSKNIKTSRFVIFNAIGAVIWSVVISAGGYVFGHALEGIIKDIHHYEVEVMIGVSVAGVLIWLIHRYRLIHKYRDRKNRNL